MKQRKIKFRAWSVSRDRYYYSDDFTDGLYAFFEYIKDVDEEIVLQQFAGINDKNGKDIYEGDIVMVVDYIGGNFVEYTYRKYKIIFERFGFEMEPIPKSNHTSSLFISEGSTIEIIGNIKETPESVK